MPKKKHSSPYLKISRKKWASLRNTVPLTLTEKELEKLKGINEEISLQEVIDIYLPLTRLLNLYIRSINSRSKIQAQFFNSNLVKIPYIIGIAGSVAVGKSTTARILQALLAQWNEHPKVSLITTDGFLHPNEVLKERNIMHKKGFPISYDIKRLIKFMSDVKSGIKNVAAPVYSHLTYDIVPNKYITISQPDILIIEGLNVLQSGMDYPQTPHSVFVSDFLDFSIYVDANNEDLEKWYVERFLKFRQGALTDPNAFFHHYTQIPEEEAILWAKEVWRKINGTNLIENILPTKARANLILKKDSNHAIKTIQLRK